MQEKMAVTSSRRGPEEARTHPSPSSAVISSEADSTGCHRGSPWRDGASCSSPRKLMHVHSFVGFSPFSLTFPRYF